VARYLPIAEHGLIGDLHTVALVGTDGTIDWYCCPRFDSPSVFAAILDADRGGLFRISPDCGGWSSKQLYLPDTNILITRFLMPDGVGEVQDFMPPPRPGEAAHRHRMIRRVLAVRGQMRFLVEVAPRFDYARAGHRVERERDGTVLFRSDGADETALRLRATVPLEVRDGDAIAEFRLGAGESAAFVLEQAVEGEESPSAAPDYVADSFKQTVNFWRHWAARSTYEGRWRETVRRSALTLKLLTSEKYGSLVAAPTFSLPEAIGGARNWDYRYTWIRDASFTLDALLRLGYTDEMAAFMGWIDARCRELEPDSMLQVMYGIDGRKQIDEHALDHLEGYRGSRPVRIGNAAHHQLQLDIYGALMDAIDVYDRHREAVSHDLWSYLGRLLDWVAEHWTQRDAGIWEVRGGPQEFLFSRVMCWVALDRGIRIARRRSLPGPIARWREVRDAIYRDVHERFWNAGRRAFVQTPGAAALDASSLLMPLVRFVSPTDPRWLSTLEALEHDLVEDSLVYRYRVGEAAPDGFETPEGSFSMCTFWFVECVARAGDVQKARLVFEKMLGYANHLGFYAEQLGRQGEHLGNFPQAFTHIGLIRAAYQLDRTLSRRGLEE
jgi:GH15 family glucan-1,4-alpha-glucosidase